MKRLLTPAIAAIALTATITASGGIFAHVRATPQGDDILIQWRTAAENGVHSFDIERSSDEVPDFRRVARLEARGTGATYSWTDYGAFYKPQSGKRFTYRVRAIGAPNADQYSPATTVIQEVSSVKRSWGMIKELFK